MHGCGAESDGAEQRRWMLRHAHGDSLQPVRDNPASFAQRRWRQVVGACLLVALAAASAGAGAPMRHQISHGFQATSAAATSGTKCLGPMQVDGLGTVQLILAGANMPGDPVGAVQPGADGRSVAIGKSGRVYFGESCAEGAYDPREYSSIDLLGRSLRFTVDLSGSKCGCVAAMYVVPLRASPSAGSCNSDYYCDAANVCGVRCAEFDIMEANTHAFHTTAHVATDPDGSSTGLGGHDQSMSASQYGPGSQGIDTTRPFEVTISINSGGSSFVLFLDQGGATRVTLPISYSGLTSSFQQMAPVLSYWYKSLDGSPILDWFDAGVCAEDHPHICSESITFSNFSIDPPIAPPPTPRPTNPSTPSTTPSTTTPRPTPGPTPRSTPASTSLGGAEPRAGSGSSSTSPPQAAASQPAPADLSKNSSAPPRSGAFSPRRSRGVGAMLLAAVCLLAR